MQSHGEWQSEFALGLVNPDLPVPHGLIDPFRRPSVKRFAVYRNNVVAGLIEALMDILPVTCRIVGAEFFKAMARIYVTHNPPDSPILLEYGKGFAHFVAGFEPAAGLPYLSDVCRIERAWLDAYHAADCSSIQSTELFSRASGEILSLRVTLHPSVRLIRSAFPSLTIWETNTEGSNPCPVDLDGNPEYAVIARPHSNVDLHSLSEPEFVFIEALSMQRTILEASELAMQSCPSFDLSAALAGVVELGLIVSFHLPHLPRLQDQEARTWIAMHAQQER